MCFFFTRQIVTPALSSLSKKFVSLRNKMPIQQQKSGKIIIIIRFQGERRTEQKKNFFFIIDAMVFKGTDHF